MAANTITSNSLEILLWNANGLLQRRSELDIFLHDKRIDLALITETHLTPNLTFFLPDYLCYRTDHPDGRAHGGSAILIKSSLLHFPCPPFQNQKIQCSTISLDCFSFQLNISSVYCPPRHQISIQEFSQLFSSLGHKFLLGGDLNAKNQYWGSRTSNPKGRNLYQTAQNENLTIITPNSPTYWPSSPSRRPDLLDIFLSRGLSTLDMYCESIADLSSDHSPVLLTVSTIPLERIKPPNLTSGIMDWDSFRQIVTENIDLSVRLQSSSDLENAVEVFVRTVQQAAWTSCKPHPVNKHATRDFPLQIRILIQERRRARRLWQQSRLPSQRQIFNNINNRLKREIRIFNQQAFEKKMESLSSEDGTLWRQTKMILGDNEIPQPLRNEDGTWVRSDVEMSEIFAAHLANSFQPHNDLQNAAHDSEVIDSLSEALPVSLPATSISPREVKRYITRLPRKKSPGYDLITSEVLKELPYKGILFLTYIFNCILRIGHFPIQWKLSEVKMILKPGKSPHHPSSYRPISLLPTCSKLFEKLFLFRIFQTVPVSSLYPNHQFGFRKSHSTVQQLHRVADYISTGLERKSYTCAVFLDVSQAFDRVWHQGLLSKLKTLIEAPYFLVLKSFLSDRFFRVRYNCEFSTLHPVLAGVPQGAVLSPFLYNIYTADIPLSDESMIASYADDIAILASSPNKETASRKIQNHLNEISSWFERWKIKLNSSKSQMITFSLRRGNCPPVTLRNEEIPQTDCVRYLGLLLDKRLTWAKHIKQKRLLLNIRLKKLYRVIGKYSKLPMQQKLTLYNYLLKPIWLYGSHIYGPAKPSNIAMIQRFQNKLLRLITGCPLYVSNLTLHTDLRVPYVTTTIKQLYRRFYDKLGIHDNPIVRDIHSPFLPTNPPRRLRRRWSRDLL
jgi:retron-type reverse transcriptase